MATVQQKNAVVEPQKYSVVLNAIQETKNHVQIFSLISLFSKYENV
jgi:hypothetical protein